MVDHGKRIHSISHSLKIFNCSPGNCRIVVSQVMYLINQSTLIGINMHNPTRKPFADKFNSREDKLILICDSNLELDTLTKLLDRCDDDQVYSIRCKIRQVKSKIEEMRELIR